MESGTIRGPRNKDKSNKPSERGTVREPLADRNNAGEPWCPESLRGMRNAKALSCRPPFTVPEGLVSLRVPLPPVYPRGYPGDENYEERNSFFHAQDYEELNPYHPTKWYFRPTLPGPLPSRDDREVYMRDSARGANYEFGSGMANYGGWFGMGDPRV